MLRSTKFFIAISFAFVFLIATNCVSESADVGFITQDGLCRRFQDDLRQYAVNTSGIPVIQVSNPGEIVKKLQYQGIELNTFCVLEESDLNYYATIVPHGISTVWHEKHGDSIYIEMREGKDEWTAVCIGIPKCENGTIVTEYL